MMLEPRLPKYQWGQRVKAVSNLENDGSFPDAPRKRCSCARATPVKSCRSACIRRRTSRFTWWNSPSALWSAVSRKRSSRSSRTIRTRRIWRFWKRSIMDTMQLSAHPNEFDRKRIERAIKARKRYRYVTPRVAATANGYRIESPCCSRNIDPEGGVVDVALLLYDADRASMAAFPKRSQKWYVGVAQQLWSVSRAVGAAECRS